jgi:membrane protease YdiL (CAAX protease family)
MPITRYVSIGLLLPAAIALIGLQLKPLGWILLVAATLSLLLADKPFAKDVLLVNVSLAILGITPITTDVSYSHMLIMGGALTLAVVIPYCISRFLYKDYLVRFPFHHGRSWYKLEIAYIIVAALISYILIPFYLVHTGAYLNWPSDSDTSSIVRLFIGTNALGIWDELFFISTVLGIFRHYFKFFFANLFQAVLFTSFLYELGFTGWGPAMIFWFALLQGYVFSKTKSLLYVITIHLTVDIVLFLALLHAHHSELMPVFLVSFTS